MIERTGAHSLAHRVVQAARKRLSNERGDTIAEVLVALLIAALGAALLATMVMVSGSAVSQTREAQAAAYDAESQTYAAAGDVEQGATVSLSAGSTTGSVAVTVYSSEDGAYARYVAGRGY